MNLEYFSLYFNDQSSFSKGKIKMIYDGFVNFFNKHKDEFSENWQINRVIEISLKNISTGIDRQIIDKALLKDPKSVLSALSMAAHFTLHNQILPYGTLYHVCINDWKSPIRHICELNSELVGSFIRIRGIIQSSTLISSKLIECRAKCAKCGKKFFISQSKKICPNCKNKNINLIIDDNPIIQYQQRFEMKDIIHICDGNCSFSSHILTLNCDIKGEMVNSIRLGEIVDVTGILKFDEKRNKINQNDRNFSLLLDANFVNKLQYTKGGYASSYVKVNDGEMIQSLGNIKEIFPILINSFGYNKGRNDNSSVYMHPMIKAAIILSMFSTHNDPVHILLSRYFDDLFSLIYPIIPHGVVFNEASVNKLTSSITKLNSSSSPSKTWFVGGSFVQANQGLLMVNDIDRFKAAQEIFLEITELGWERVDSLHKISTNFSSIVIADPKNLNSTVLNNAFTMIFELDDELTNSLTSYMVTPRSSASHSQRNQLKSFQNDDINVCNESKRYEQWNNNHLTFAERLSLATAVSQGPSTKTSMGVIDSLTFLKYVTYARQFVTPKWSQDAIEKLKDVASNTMKDLLAIRNMAQCRARIELRSKVEASDVVDCAEILEWSRNPPHDKSKQQMVKNSHSRGNSKQKMIVDFMNEFKKIASYKENGIVEEKEIKELADMLNVTSKFYSFEHFMDALTMNNLVLLSGPKKYRVGSTL